MVVNDTSQTIKKDKVQRPVIAKVLQALILTNTTAAPSNPTDGMIVYTDGVSWNPGSGKGIYAYYNSTWNKL